MSELKNLAAALVKASQEVAAVEKRGHNKHNDYVYATADDVVQTAKKALLAEGLTVVPGTSVITAVGEGQKALMVLTRSLLLVHESGESVPGSVSYPLVMQALEPRACGLG